MSRGSKSDPPKGAGTSTVKEAEQAHGHGDEEREEVDILLINPPFFQTPSDQSYSYYYPPLGLLYITAVLDREGYSTRIYNPVFEHKYITLDDEGFPPLTDETREAFKDSFIGYPDSREWRQMISELSRISPKVVGITITTPQYDLAVLLARVIKEQNPDVPIVVGGVHPSALPEETMTNPEFDLLVYGEGEITTVELMEVFVDGKRSLSDVRGIYYREDGKLVKNPPRELIADIDSLPFPMPDPVYAHHPRRAILTSRGCYYRCTFCSQSSILGHKVRFRSPENVLDEIEYWYNQGIRQFIIQDSTFTSNIERSMEIMDLIKSRGLKINWGFQTRVDLLPRELLTKAKEAGCDYIWIGVESGDLDILKAIKKGITPDQVREAVKVINEFDMETYLYFILGFDEDTEETMRATQDFAVELDCYQTSFFIFTPFPGSESFDNIVADDRLLIKDYFYYFWLYPYLFNRQHLANDRVFEYYHQVKDYWAEKKKADIRRRSLQPAFVWKKIRENAYSPRALARLARKFFQAHSRT